MKSYIKCVNVDYESSRVEDFYDIQLNVKGCQTLRDSFKDYIQEEILEGDNKYQAEGYGLQDAKKGVIFESFPPVLHLQLKRFEYDLQRDAMVKINDRHEFPMEIDLEEFLSEDTDRTNPHKYLLHGVLVHSGDSHEGHYFVLFKPEKDGKWFKFDDDHVIPVIDKEVFEDNYGGEYPNENTITIRSAARNHERFTNAYMLVYIRESNVDEILSPVVSEDIPEHLRMYMLIYLNQSG
ncbi:cysteine proteinase [Rhizophagus irregularis]|uniref:Cysteine proteinase n=1 Tax=Rhizophagus irregularis TaxID=588596 RepID=A0A2I1HU06_9GLOM|nr:cysteine proteinase [Rhizophagus irregularis]